MAEALLNPWGDDDDDFQISFLIDRNFQVTIFKVRHNIERSIPINSFSYLTTSRIY